MNDLLRALLALPPQASSFARAVDELHYWVIAVTMVGSTGVALVAAYFVVRYRAGAMAGRRDRGPRRTGRHPWTELAAVGGLLALFLAFWLFGFGQYVMLRTPPASATTIYVTGKQWMWKFAYPGGQSAIDVLTVPVGRPVELVMTSRDVIHSFYVPAFRVKYDVVPGRYTTAWFEATEPGEYPIYCAEFCGVSHSLMKGRVVVLRPDEYAAWLERAGRTEASVPMAERGRLAAVKYQCFACHTIDGRNHVGPSWRGLYGATVLLDDGRRIVADEAYLTRSMMRPLDDRVAGYRPVMPTYAGVLSAPDAAAIVEYVRALRDAPAAEGLDLPPAADPRASLIAGGADEAHEGVNTGLPPSAAPATSAPPAPPVRPFTPPPRPPLEPPLEPPLAPAPPGAPPAVSADPGGPLP